MKMDPSFGQKNYDSHLQNWPVFYICPRSPMAMTYAVPTQKYGPHLQFVFPPISEFSIISANNLHWENIYPQASLGGGILCHIYRVKRISADHPPEDCVLKILTVHTPNAVRLFTSEIRHTQRLYPTTQPIAINWTSSPTKLLAFIMPYLHGFELYTLINHLHSKKTQLKISNLLNLSLLLCCELHRIHSIAHIEHFDLKPENIIFNEKKQTLNIIDFGFSVELGKRAHTLGGTFTYNSPEGLCLELKNHFVSSNDPVVTDFLLKSERISGKSDIYSLGLILALLHNNYFFFFQRVALNNLFHKNQFEYLLLLQTAVHCLREGRSTKKISAIILQPNAPDETNEYSAKCSNTLLKQNYLLKLEELITRMLAVKPANRPPILYIIRKLCEIAITLGPRIMEAEKLPQTPLLWTTVTQNKIVQETISVLNQRFLPSPPMPKESPCFFSATATSQSLPPKPLTGTDNNALVDNQQTCFQK